MSNRNLILTGGNRGIGNAILRVFAQDHTNVWCLDREFDAAFQDQIVQLQEEYGVWIRPILTDLQDRRSIAHAMSVIHADREPVDILVNNAGINHRGTFLMTTLEEMDRLFQVNYFAAVQLMQLAAKRMIRQRKGIIINVGSVSGFEHNTGNFAYSVTKSALMWATQTLSRELAPYQIRVNGVAPGVTSTMINQGNEAALAETVLPRMNIKRYAEPEEIARVVAFLAGEDSSFVSGQIIRVDGGRF